MISYLLNSILISILFADLLERKFPEQFRTFLTEVTFNAFYLYSKLQIYFTKVNNNINNFVESNPALLKIKNGLDAIMRHKKGVVTKTEFIKNGEREDGINCDFSIFSWLSDDKNCVNKKIIYDINEPMNMSECSDIKFILIELQVREKTYKVDLKTDDYNFYLVGNKFTKQFFIYYLKQYLQMNESINDTDIIQLKIIDHDVNIINIEFTDKNDSILLEKIGYKVSDNNK